MPLSFNESINDSDRIIIIVRDFSIEFRSHATRYISVEKIFRVIIQGRWDDNGHDRVRHSTIAIGSIEVLL